MLCVIRPRRPVAVAVLVTLIAGIGAFGPGLRAAPASAACTDSNDEAAQLAVTVDKQRASGWVALPAGKPKGIVAFAHGYGHSGLSWVHHIRWAARELGVIAVAMDYRGAKMSPPKKDGDLPSSRGWNVSAGAADTIAASRLYEACVPDAVNVIFGVSMGGNTSGLIVADGPQRAGGKRPLFDYWVDVEGVTNVISTYLSARAVAPYLETARNATEDISAEMGGPIEAVPQVYLERSIVTRGEDIAAGGLKGVVMVHGVEDGTVGYDQTREMAAVLDDVGVPAQVFTVLRKNSQSERDSTYSSYVGNLADPKYKSPFAGHASEKSTVHSVMKTALERLVALYAGEVPECRSEHVVDGESPPSPAPGPC